MKVVLFPANKLGVKVAPIYNGHDAIVSFNTDRLVDNNFEVAEMELLKNNLKATSFLNPRGHLINENSDYEQLISDVKKTDVIDFGMYYNTNAWISPITNQYEVIPDYNSNVWTSKGVSVFKNAVLGQSKKTRFPNHGQEIFDISGGDYGFNYANGEIGKSKLSEFIEWTKWQFDTLSGFGADKISCASYMNGANEMNPLLLPYLLGARNSDSSKTGDSQLSYLGDRGAQINRASSTRVWDDFGSFNGNEDTWGIGINYAISQIDLAIQNNGFYSDFTHWHSVYGRNLSRDTIGYFGYFFNAINEHIINKDIWRCGYSQALEYLFMREIVELVGSFEDNNVKYIALSIKDKYKYLFYNSVSEELDFTKINMPLSIEFSGYFDLSSEHIDFIRKKEGKTIITLKPDFNKEGYFLFELVEGESNVYTDSLPLIRVDNNKITTDTTCKIAIYSKDKGANLKELKCIYRSNYFATENNFNFKINKDYYIGAINVFEMSNLLKL